MKSSKSKGNDKALLLAQLEHKDTLLVLTRDLLKRLQNMHQHIAHDEQVKRTVEALEDELKK